MSTNRPPIFWLPPRSCEAPQQPGKGG